MTEQETTPSTQTQASKDLVDIGLELYEQKASYDKIIDLFKEAQQQHPNDSGVYTCLAWLHLLRNDPGDGELGFQYAKKGMKLDRSNAQAHFNLILAMLMTGRKGVREEVDVALRKCVGNTEAMKEATDNLKDALERRSDFPEAAKLLSWLQSE